MIIRKEVFKPITGFNGLYEVSNLGRIISTPGKIIVKGDKVKSHTRVYQERELVQNVSNTGYYLVSLQDPVTGDLKSYNVHRLVALEFVFNPDPNIYIEVNHLDGNKLNNKVDNMEWVTRSENILHAYRTGLISRKREMNEDHHVVFMSAVTKECLVFYSMAQAARYFKVSYYTVRVRIIGEVSSAVPGTKFYFVETTRELTKELSKYFMVEFE